MLTISMPAGSDGADLLKLLFERAGNRQDVPVLLHDHDPADDFSGAVEVDGAPALVVADLDVADVLEPDRFPVGRRPMTRNSS